jgi:hypothetical protein
MQNILAHISLKLNDSSLMDDWKKMSANITESLKNVDGFIYRDSAVSEDGTIYCLIKWESIEKQEAFRKILESDAFKNEMVEFAKIVNMESMKAEILQVV